MQPLVNRYRTENISEVGQSLLHSNLRRSMSLPSWLEQRLESQRLIEAMPSFEHIFVSTMHDNKAYIFTETSVKQEKTKVINFENLSMELTKGEDCIEMDTTKKKKKKKKFQKMNICDLGFNMSLLPRPTKSSHIEESEVQSILYEIDKEYLDMEEKITPFENCLRFEGHHVEDKFLRSDKDRKVIKAHKQVKDKYCKSVRNNEGRKTLYIHHRVVRLMQMEAKRIYLHFPSPSRKTLDNYVKQKVTQVTKIAPVQSLAHTLHNQIAVPNDLPTDLIGLLISLQHRDISPEDYDTLLRLDDSVAPKTVSDNVLMSFHTDVVDINTAGDVCSVCMEGYEIGQSRKWLPCEHVFHDNCIDMWLKNSSMNCPLDGLPVNS